MDQTARDDMRCAKCGAELEPGEKFCGECGQPVQVSAAPSTPASQTPVTTCPNCTANVDPGKRFCSSCGYDLMAAAPKPQPTVACPAVAPALSLPETARTSSSSARIALIVGVGALVAVLFLGSVGFGLWLWLGARGKTPSIAGTWNCETTELGERRSVGGITLVQEPPRRTFRMILVQSDTTITVTLLNDQGRRDQYTGTFDGQKFSFTVLNEALVQLVLSLDGSTMKGEAQELKGATKHTVVCTR